MKPDRATFLRKISFCEVHKRNEPMWMVMEHEDGLLRGEPEPATDMQVLQDREIALERRLDTAFQVIGGLRRQVESLERERRNSPRPVQSEAPGTKETKFGFQA